MSMSSCPVVQFFLYQKPSLERPLEFFVKIGRKIPPQKWRFLGEKFGVRLFYD